MVQDLRDTTIRSGWRLSRDLKPARQQGRIRRWSLAWLKLVGFLGIVSGLIWFLGFVSFMATLSTGPRIPAKADAIVALTGGDTRLQEALDLLQQDKGARLLISGVNPSIPRQDVEDLVPKAANLFRCCVDLDRAAANTIGNARHTARWAEGKGYASLIVVTADYHMPRSLLEFSLVMPDMNLIPYPIQSERVNIADWWRRQGTAAFLAGEYNKYLIAFLRIRVLRSIKAA